MRRGGIFVGVLGVALLLPLASAEGREEPKLIEEFLTAEPCYVEAKGELQLGSAFDYRKPAGDLRFPVLAEYGITDRIQAEVEASYLSVSGGATRNRGQGDLELGLHYALRPEVEEVAVTLGAGVSLPTGEASKGLGTGETGVELLGIAGLRLGAAELHVAGMLEFEHEVEPALNAAAVYPLADFRFTLESNLLRGGQRTRIGEQDLTDVPEQPGSENLWLVVTPGLFHRPRQEIEYGIGLPIGLTRAAPDWGVIGRVTIELDVLGRE